MSRQPLMRISNYNSVAMMRYTGYIQNYRSVKSMLIDDERSFVAL